ncbi:MAG: HlyD family efflux transporter periplasmic adaptor subunit [Clostridiales bacterium]|nr:HlyD family efflux transporter periplasmic adaptor subunit [Clostridiales bacterium]
MKKTVQKIYEKLHNNSFLHKRRLYVILTIVFSVLLLADIGMARMIPDTSARGDFQNMQMSGSFGDTDSAWEDSENSDDTDSVGDGSENADDTDSTDESGDADSAMRGGGRGDSDTETADGDSDSSDSSGFEMQGTPDNGSGTPPSDMSDGEMPDFDSEDFDGYGNGGDFDFEASDDGTDSSADEETGSYPDMSDFVDAQSGNASSALSVLQAIRSHWLLILIILAILDAGSIFMLIRLSRKEKERIAAQEKALREEAAKTGDIHIARPVKKESRHSHYLWIIAVIVIVLLIIMVKLFTRQTDSSTAETEATVYSGTAELGDISTVLPGTGTLEEEDAYELSLPDEVEITKWYVSDGDTVEEGDVLASVDQVSVMTAIATVQSTMTSLDEALEDCEDDAVSGTITAAADGRVIAIYAESGTDVVDTMYENEALMLLSLDGYMAVSIDTSADISAGDSVNVTLSDGTVVSGKVESMASTTAVITVSDNGPDLGDLVSVETEDGTYVGEGTLYIHSELKVTGFTGTVSSISVSEGSTVSSGDTLLTLTDTDYTGQYELLLEQRSELESQMETLFQLYEDGYIYASESGVISGLSDSGSDEDSSSGEDSSDDSSSDSTSESSSDSADATGYTDSSSNDSSVSGSLGYSIQNLSLGSGVSGSAVCQTTGSGRTVQTAAVSATDVLSVQMTTLSAGDGESTQITTLSSATSGSDDDTDSVTTWIGVVSEITSETAELTSLTGTDSLSLDLETSVEVTIYADGSLETGSVSDVAVGDILILSYDSDGTLSQIVCISMNSSSDEEDSDSSSETTDSSTDTSSQSGSSDSRTDSSGSGGTSGSGDASGSQSGSQNVYGTVTDGSGSMQDSSDGSSMSDASSAMSGSTDTDSTEASDAATEALEEEISSTYGVSETTWLSITPQDTMTLTITVDEMDILSIEVGQEATVTLDAFPGQSFDGEVTSIDESGTNSGGSSKYTAEVTISREEGMLAGMNASAVITLDTSEDVLIIPEAALVEQDNAVYVYTTYDESSDTFGGLTEVTTGVSDGENVEILSGLEEGGEYCYSYLDVVNYSSASSSSGSSTGSGSALESLFGGGGGMGGGR